MSTPQETKRASYTLFSVTQEDRESRSKRIQDFFEEQPALAYLVAAFNLEWTIRRAIAVLSPCPTKVLWKYFEDGHVAGWNAYQSAWKKCIVKIGKLRLNNNDAKTSVWQILTLAEIVYVEINPNNRTQKQLGGASNTAKDIETALKLRHILVHGQKGSIPRDSAKTNFGLLLKASEAIAKYVEIVLPIVWREKKRRDSGVFGRIVRTKCRCQRYEKGKKCPFQTVWDELENVKVQNVATVGDAIQYLCFNKNIGDKKDIVKTTISNVETEKLCQLMKMPLSKSTFNSILQFVTTE